LNLIKDIALYIVIGAGLTALSYWLESDFLFTYLNDDIVTLLLTLLAINIASSGLIASKIQDLQISLENTIDFSETIGEMKLALLEQIILIVASIILFLLQDSAKIQFSGKEEILNGLLVTILVYAIAILWDTGKAVFIVIQEIDQLNKSDD
jgi:cytochrome c biogenesis factor